MLRRLPLLGTGTALVGAALACSVAAGAAARPDVVRGVAYRNAHSADGSQRALKLDVYRPAGRHVAPVLVYVHGGGFVFGSRAAGSPVGHALAAQGWAVVSIDYRLRTPLELARSGYAPAIEDARQDAAAALRWVRANAARYRLDPRRIAVGGHSAGAITALHVGLNPKRGGIRPCLVVSIAGGAPRAAVGTNPSPTLFFHDPADPVVPFRHAQEAQAAARAAGGRTWLVTLPRAGHTPRPDVVQRLIVPETLKRLRGGCPG
ncbi:MAG TPA: alpha/beta hydrolase [Gaiellaceae bacterium]|nr:alpha/beta hydrolase [Gaiellaceae bacterium]